MATEDYINYSTDPMGAKPEPESLRITADNLGELTTEAKKAKCFDEIHDFIGNHFADVLESELTAHELWAMMTHIVNLMDISQGYPANPDDEFISIDISSIFSREGASE
jgi:hypothetical protein